MSNQNFSIPSLKAKAQVSFKQNQVGQNNVSFNAIGDDIDPAATIASTMTNSPIADRVMDNHNISNGVLIPTTAGVWLASNYLVDKVNKSCSGNYEDCFFGKIGDKCDKFSTNTWLGRKLQGFFDWFDTKTTNLSKKSRIVNTLKNHSTRPEWGFAKFPFYGLKGFLGMDLTANILSDFMSPITSETKIFGIRLNRSLKFQKLEQYGMTNQQIDDFVRSLSGKSTAEKALALQKLELEKLGASAADIATAEAQGFTKLEELAKDLKIKTKLQFGSRREYERFLKICQDAPEEAYKVLQRAKAADPNLITVHWKPYKFLGSRSLGKIVGKVFGRPTTWAEYENKYRVALGQGAKSTLGKLATKSIAWAKEGATGRFAFGKLFAIIAAVDVAKALIHTFKAKGAKEKGKTAAERTTHIATGAAVSTAAVALMHKLGGFKYAGLDTKEEVEAYRRAQKTFNNRVKAGVFTGNKAGYKAGRDAVEAMLHPEKIKNPITKLLFRLGKIINMGNENIAKYKGTSTFMNIMRRIPNTNLIGVPLRIWLGGLALSGLISKMIMGTEHKIFGKPQFSIDDEDKGEDETQTQADQNGTQANVDSVNQTQQPVQKPKSPQDYQSDTNLIKMAANGQYPHNNNPSGTTQTGEPDEPVRTYVPSPECFVTKSVDLTPGEEALARADMAEKYCDSILKSMK